MPKRIPISAAKKFAIENGCRQVVIAAWDGDLVHVVTYGKTAEDCDNAAMAGDRYKKAIGWPEHLNAKPSRLRAAEARVDRAEAEVSRLTAALDEERHNFKNFHRNLCDRFGYTHDEADWQRDLISLIEWIAARLQTAEAERDRLAAVVAEAGKVIEPFAALSHIFDQESRGRPKDGPIMSWSDHRVGDRELTVEHLRAARAWQEKHGEAG